jgi:AraC family transcriptional regulator
MPTNQSIQKALDFIESNITDNISLYDIACAAGFSVPHFYRLFKRLTGDTVGAYIMRRRLSLAARDILKTDKTIASIAYEYGFESHDVFTRAFSRIYGMSPRRYRDSDGAPPLKRYTVLEQEQRLRHDQMSFRILRSKGFEVVGMKCDATRWDTDGAIGRLWSDFLTRVDEIKHAVSPMIMYGICSHESCKSECFPYFAGIGVSCSEEIPCGMVSYQVKEQTYLQADVPEFIDVPDAYIGAIGYARSLGYEIEEKDDIEVYEEVFRDPAIYSFQLLIPIKE